MGELSKTHEEIKKGLGWCANDTFLCSGKCPYFNSLSNGVDCAQNLHSDALAIIQQLEAGIAEFEMVAMSPGVVEDMARENAELLEKIKQLEQERDAAVNDLATIHKCAPCKHRSGNDYISNNCLSCVNFCNFEWRGLCKENGGTE